ncbi:MAG TPA: phage holin family protein [Ktedonobacterales bacterium]|nr:phage holin family protein [Ktedonobacterales bacterium]
MQSSTQGNQANEDDRSIGSLVSDLSRQMSTLARQEINLAKAEMTQKAKAASKDIALIAAGGVLALAALLALLATITLGLIQLGVTWWLAALVVTVIVAILAYALAQIGVSGLKRLNPTPQQTVDTLKEDVTWAKDQIRA